MKNKLFLCLIALITFGLYSCEDTISVGVPATITINVRDFGQPLPNTKVYMFEDKFNDKNFNFQYFREGTRKGIKSGIVEVELDEPLLENVQWYLGIENPDSKNDIYVTIEVCALVFHE